MSIEKGFLLSCDRCSNTEFISKAEWEANYTEVIDKINFNNWETHKDKLLCPDCVQDYRRAMFDFWHSVPSSQTEYVKE